MDKMLISYSTNKSVKETAEALHKAVLANEFGVLQVHDLQKTMIEKGVDFERQCLIFEVCNPFAAKLVLEADMRISTALPCRISVFEQDTKTFIVTMKPSMMLSMFQVPDLSSTALEVEKTMIKIMREAIA